MTQILLSSGAPLPNSLSLTHNFRAHTTCIYAYAGWLANSYAVPKEVGKVGVQSPTFIEPVQKRKDGIEAMFSRQAKAAQQPQQKSASRDAPPAAATAAGSGKRKRESSPPTEEKDEEKQEKETSTSVSTTAPSSPAKRSKVKKDPIKHDDTVDSEEEKEGNSDVEILPSGPSSSSLPSQSQSVGHARPLHFHRADFSYAIFVLFGADF